MIYKTVKSVEIELNTICNSWCPVCVRYEARDDGLYYNPNLEINKVLDVSYIESVFSSALIDDIVNVDLIGTAGEPLSHPKIFDVISTILKYKPQARFNIHTNGGIRTEKFFTELAAMLSHSGGARVCFSLDGLEDTNHIYRIGVKWDKAIQNMKAFIAAGGNALWQFVIFPWNEHQLEECKKLAYSLGCYAFETRSNVVGNEEIQYNTEKANLAIFKKYAPKLQKNPADFKVPEYDYIDDMCFSKEGIFIDVYGKIFPCCMFSADETDTMASDHLKKTMYEKYGFGWNHLDNNSIDDILNHEWWTDLYSDLHISKTPCDICIRQCGTMSDNRSYSRIEETRYDNPNFNE